MVLSITDAPGLASLRRMEGAVVTEASGAERTVLKGTIA